MLGFGLGTVEQADLRVTVLGRLLDDLQPCSPYAFEIVPSGRSVVFAPAQKPLTLVNRGYRRDAYRVTLEGESWPVSLSPDQSPWLAPHTPWRPTLQVSLPPDSVPGMQDTVTVTFQSLQQVDLRQTVVLDLVDPHQMYLPVVWRYQGAGTGFLLPSNYNSSP